MNFKKKTNDHCIPEKNEISIWNIRDATQKLSLKWIGVKKFKWVTLTWVTEPSFLSCNFKSRCFTVFHTGSDFYCELYKDVLCKMIYTPK